jgi:hypothetical protein
MPGTFYSRYEKALRVTAGPAVVDGRLQGIRPVDVVNLTDPGEKLPADAHYELFGPGDVQRLAAGAITRRYPAPGASDAEERKLALVEFGDATDLPWRYTPSAAAGAILRPWLVLVVGRRRPDEITLRPDGRVTLGPVAQDGHKLVDSWQWAHVHAVDGKQIARILSPLNLTSEEDYVACVVPAFTAAGTDAWTGGAPTTVDCYDRWSFRTGPQGDFPELAAKLHKAKLSGLEKPFGRADVTYRPLSAGDVTVLATAGALKLPPDGTPDPADAPPPAAVAAEVTALSRRIVTPDGRGVVTAPRYEAPFTDPDGAQSPPVPGGWVDELRSDPRPRGAAGLGAWTAIEWQDKISDAAAAKAGDLVIAHDRIRHVALGVEVSRSLWRRRVPPEAAPSDRLAVLSPVLGRLPAAGGGTVLDAVAGRTPSFTKALLSSAARRALRPGPARTALAQPGAGRFGTVLEVAGGCPREDDDPADIRRGAGDPEAALKAAVDAATGGDGELTARILERLGEHPSPGRLLAAFQALAPGKDGEPDRERVQEFLSRGEFPDPDVPLTEWPGWMNEAAPPPPCRPIDLGGLSTAVARAIDPTVARPPAVRRVLATLPGFTHIGPVEIEPELDLPLWSFLSQHSPDWMLPGAGDLKEHEVAGLSTNPAFVQALLAGANQQATGELRWRNIPMTSRWSPLRKFWQRIGGAFDINPIKGWPGGEPLGSTMLAYGGLGAEAVVVCRTPLFRRYPATVVYLFPADENFTPPDPNVALVAGRQDPTFTGTIGPDITFFGFTVPPSALKDHWVVLEEPPAGYRFYHGSEIPPAAEQIPAPPPPEPDDNAAHFAYNRFAAPVRVLIGPLLKEVSP